MKKFIILLLVLVAAGAGGWAYMLRRNTVEPSAQTQPLTRGDVVETVGATGTLEAVETVDVGTQVSGVVQALYADFNSIVKRGQVIAKLDPQLIETQIEQQTANVVRAEAELDRLRVQLDDARQKLERAKQMSAKNLIPRTELETAEVNVRAAEAQIRSSEAALTQARAQLNNQKVNLGYTTITAPIDGIVISRNVDQGQTVAASMNAPTLYIIAADLAKMQVVANIDEADVGRMRPGQRVTFRVDAYPADTFIGTVSQVRLQPAVVQNVVTYSTVIDVPNPELKLKPGMTATVTIEIARRNDVLRVANRALSFRPAPEMFAALNQPLPPELERGRGGFSGRGRGDGLRGGGPPAGGAPALSPAGAAAGGTPPAPPAQAPAGATETRRPRGQQPPPGAQAPAAAQAPAEDGRSNQPDAAQARGAREGASGEGVGRGEGRGGLDPDMTPEERQRRREERLKDMTPEERAAFESRMREGGGRSFGGRGPDGMTSGRQAAGAGQAAAAGRANAGRQNAAPGRVAAPPASGTHSRAAAAGATTIDQLFAPIPAADRPGMAWLFQEGQLKPLRLRLGITDGTWTEVLNESELPPDIEVVVSFTTGLEQRTPTAQPPQGNPLMGPQRGGGGRGRGF